MHSVLLSAKQQLVLLYWNWISKRWVCSEYVSLWTVLYSWSAFCRKVVILQRQFLPLWSKLSAVLAPVTIYYIVITGVTATWPPFTISAVTYQSLWSELLCFARVVEFDTTSSIQYKLLCWDIQLYCQFLQHKLGILPWVRGGFLSGHQALPTWFSCVWGD